MAGTMRAVQAEQLGGPEVLRAVEVPRPEPIQTEVLVAVHAAGVNPVDAKTRQGAGMSRVAGDPPFIPGWDVAGVVEEVGYGVTRFAAGDRVFGMPWFPRPGAAYAEYVTAPSRQFARMPAELDFNQAAALPLAALTAWQGLVDTAGVRSGDSVLVLAGAGGVGHLAVQIAKALGATVTATARPDNHEFLRELGADEVVDRLSVPIERSARDVDVVVDLVGREATVPALETLRPGGVLIAIARGADVAERDEAAARRGVRVGELLVEPDGHALELIATLVDSGAVTVHVDAVVPLEQAAEAHARIERGGMRGKVVLAVR